MLQETLTTALKEWAVVQRSLLEGHQIVLLRKGGLVEETGDFDLKARQFLLYPTYEHETERAGDLQPCFGQWLREEEARKLTPGEIRIEAAAEVSDVVRVEDRAKLLNLAPQHLWSPQFIHGRYDWEPYKPVFVLLLRAYALREPIVIPVERGLRRLPVVDHAVAAGFDAWRGPSRLGQALCSPPGADPYTSRRLNDADL